MLAHLHGSHFRNAEKDEYAGNDGHCESPKKAARASVGESEEEIPRSPKVSRGQTMSVELECSREEKLPGTYEDGRETEDRDEAEIPLQRYVSARLKQQMRARSMLTRKTCVRPSMTMSCLSATVPCHLSATVALKSSSWTSSEKCMPLGRAVVCT